MVQCTRKGKERERKTKMCDYCEKGFDNEPLVNTESVCTWIENGALCTQSNDGFGWSDIVVEKIDCCPKCGRKL